MRKLMLVFLMLFLPLQWTAALAADCCLRHDAQTKEHHAQQAVHHEHAQYEHHAKADVPSANDLADNLLAQAQGGDCNVNCAGCHAHHCAAAVFEPAVFSALLPSGMDNTPYLSHLTMPLPDNLFRPPLSTLA